jgi:hypothetical protein
MRNRIERSELIQAVREGGETLRAAAARLAVPVSTAQRWMRIAASESPTPTTPTTPTVSKRTPKPRFVEAVVERTESCAIRVCVGVAEIEVRTGFDATLLREVAAALGGDA